MRLILILIHLIILAGGIFALINIWLYFLNKENKK